MAATSTNRWGYPAISEWSCHTFKSLWQLRISLRSSTPMLESYVSCSSASSCFCNNFSLISSRGILFQHFPMWAVLAVLHTWSMLFVQLPCQFWFHHNQSSWLPFLLTFYRSIHRKWHLSSWKSFLWTSTELCVYAGWCGQLESLVQQGTLWTLDHGWVDCVWL